MSDTPRTNECTFDVIVKRGDAHLGVEHYKDGSGDFVESDFCKKLERELNAANSIIRQQQLLDEENLSLRQRIKRIESAIDRASKRFFADGSDGKVAAEMLTIICGIADEES